MGVGLIIIVSLLLAASCFELHKSGCAREKNPHDSYCADYWRWSNDHQSVEWREQGIVPPRDGGVR